MSHSVRNHGDVENKISQKLVKGHNILGKRFLQNSVHFS
ncbi:hypothetical protein RU94_GL001368 [Enterococcus asini]|nr:hypothetical protein RU94_GL001368 [Enterococcus asini]